MYQALGFDLAATLTGVEQAGLFISLASILRRPGGTNPTVDSFGQVDQVPADYTPVTGLQNIPAMLSVLSTLRPDILAVLRLPDGFDVHSLRHLLLDGYFPEPTIQRSDLVNVDGTVYQIMSGPEVDSQHIMTRMAVRVYTK